MPNSSVVINLQLPNHVHYQSVCHGSIMTNVNKISQICEALRSPGKPQNDFVQIWKIGTATDNTEPSYLYKQVQIGVPTRAANGHLAKEFRILMNLLTERLSDA